MTQQTRTQRQRQPGNRETTSAVKCDYEASWALRGLKSTINIVLPKCVVPGLLYYILFFTEKS